MRPNRAKGISPKTKYWLVHHHFFDVVPYIILNGLGGWSRGEGPVPSLHSLVFQIHSNGTFFLLYIIFYWSLNVHARGTDGYYVFTSFVEDIKKWYSWKWTNNNFKMENNRDRVPYVCEKSTFASWQFLRTFFQGYDKSAYDCTTLGITDDRFVCISLTLSNCTTLISCLEVTKYYLSKVLDIYLLSPIANKNYTLSTLITLGTFPVLRKLLFFLQLYHHTCSLC